MLCSNHGIIGKKSLKSCYQKVDNYLDGLHCLKIGKHACKGLKGWLGGRACPTCCASYVSVRVSICITYMYDYICDIQWGLMYTAWDSRVDPGIWGMWKDNFYEKLCQN